MWYIKVSFKQPKQGLQVGYLSAVRLMPTGLDPSFASTTAQAQGFVSYATASLASRVIIDRQMSFEIIKKE